MAAGLGFKDFATGEVLTAADVDGYLMQGIWVFASTAARDAAVTSPSEGNFAFTKDTNSLWYYDGAAWVASGATGDIEGVTAGIGISGGGTSGTVTVTNSMATAIDAKGDLVAGTGADTFAKLTVGANDTILTADSSTATGLKWATPAGGGGMTLLSTTTLSGASTTISVTPTGYLNLYILATKVNCGSNARLYLAPNGQTSISQTAGLLNYTAGLQTDNFNLDYIKTNDLKAAETNNSFVYEIFNVNSTTEYKNWSGVFGFEDSSNRLSAQSGSGIIRTNSAISSLVFSPAAGTFSGGTVLVYGVK
jgi:hypothetical protein